MDKVIVIGCGVPGYGVIRALANRNIEIIAMTYARKDAAQFSKYVSEVVNIPVPEQDEDKFIELLTRNALKWGGALIVETSDNTSVALSKHKEVLSKYYRLVTPDREVHRFFLEKEKTYELAKECNVPIPRSIRLSRLEDIQKSSEIQYPCILKPVRSFEFVSRFMVKNFEVNNESELIEKAKLCLDAGIPMLLQEIIPGPDENLFKLQGYINSQGRTVGKFFHRKLRQHPPHFGVMRVGISTEAYPEVEQLAGRLLNHVNYRGYFSIEFKKDPRDGQLKLMENNCRLVRCSLLATASGVNHPWIIYQDLLNNQQVDVTDYKVGTYWIELYADISDSLFFHTEENINMSDYIRPYLARNKAYADLDFHDLKPFMELTRQKTRNASQKIFGRLHLLPSRTAMEAK